MIDYHIHPDFSQDAQGSMEEYCRRALELGLEEICFTTHHECDPVRRDREFVRVGEERMTTDSEWPVAYFAEINRVRRQFPGLVIKAGVEVGYEMGVEGIVSDFLAAYPFDFVLGAVHLIDHIALTSGGEVETFQAAFGHRPAEYVIGRYFDYVRAAAGSGLFDCLAHLDIYRKYVQPMYGPEFSDSAARQMDSTLEFIARSKVGLEVNTSALRRGDSEPYPALSVLHRARDAGITVFTIGSDAHKPQDLGTGLDKATRFLSDLGIVPARFVRRRLSP